MARGWRFQVFIATIFFTQFVEKRSFAHRRFGFSTRTNPYRELLQEKMVKLQLMKNILAKLGMKERPPYVPIEQRRHNIPGPVIGGEISPSTAEVDEKEVQIIVTAEEGNREDCKDYDACFTFKLDHTLLQKYRIDHAAVYIYNEVQSASVDLKIVAINEMIPQRKRRSTGADSPEDYVSKDLPVNKETKKYKGRHRRGTQFLKNDTAKEPVYRKWQTKRHTHTSQSGWIHLSVDDILRRWLLAEQGTAVHHMLQFSGHGLTASRKPRFRPFIIVDMIEVTLKKVRKQRSHKTRCVPGQSRCCLKDFYVRFKDIGWEDWIIQPEGYEVNLCDGECMGFRAMTPHSQAITKMLPSLGGEKSVPKICCIPLKFDSLTLLYFDGDGLIHKSEFENMAARECGCVR